jgi:hypothetical protein
MAFDKAGNNATSATRTFGVDSTPPEITPSVSGTLGQSGWYTSVVTVVWSLDVDGTCLDLAGNSSAPVASNTFRYDATGPTASLTATAGTLGANGWYVADVTIGTSGNESVSGPVTCTPDQFQTVETTGTVFNGSCTNDAGLTTHATPLTVKLDKTGPSATLAVSSGTLGMKGWYTSDVTIETSGLDSISGPVVCSATQLQVSDTTGTTFDGRCTNNAGLSTNATPLTVKRDMTPPSLNPVVTPSPIVLNGPGTASPGASDVTSGVASSSCEALDTSSVGQKNVSCVAVDNAGNIAHALVEYSVKYASNGSCLDIS